MSDILEQDRALLKRASKAYTLSNTANARLVGDLIARLRELSAAQRRVEALHARALVESWDGLNVWALSDALSGAVRNCRCFGAGHPKGGDGCAYRADYRGGES